MKAPLDMKALEHATVRALDGGHRLFHTHRLSPSDVTQANDILGAAGFEPGARVLDAGCGIGELAWLMSKERPDLSFVLVNLSHYQLSLCPTDPQFQWLHADMHDLPLEAEQVDATMFVSALTQMDAKFALHEAARVTRPGGMLFLFEMVRAGGDADEFEAVTTARVYTIDELIGFAEAAGFGLDYEETVHSADDSHMRSLLREVGREYLMDPICLAVMRFFKE